MNIDTLSEVFQFELLAHRGPQSFFKRTTESYIYSVVHFTSVALCGL